jgi:hypothetical protein
LGVQGNGIGVSLENGDTKMKKVTVALVALLAVSQALIAKGPNIPGYRHTQDKFTGDINDIIEFSFHVDKKFELDPVERTASGSVFRSFVKGNPVPQYDLIIIYDAKDWIFISDGETLIFLLDGSKKIILSGSGSASSRDVEDGGIQETAGYLITRDQLAQIAGSKKAEFKLIGTKGDETGSLSQTKCKNIGKFLALFPNG